MFSVILQWVIDKKQDRERSRVWSHGWIRCRPNVFQNPCGAYIPIRPIAKRASSPSWTANMLIGCPGHECSFVAWNPGPGMDNHEMPWLVDAVILCITALSSIGLWLDDLQRLRRPEDEYSKYRSFYHSFADNLQRTFIAHPWWGLWLARVRMIVSRKCLCEH